MAVNLSLFAGAGAQFFDNNGLPLVGGLLYSYAAGTSTQAATYTSSSGLTSNSNPIVLDSAGRVPNEIWLTPNSTYKFSLQTSAAVQIGSWDNIPGANDQTALLAFEANLASSTGSSLIGYNQGGTGAITTTVQAKLRQTVSVKDFGAVGDGTTDDTVAIQAALTQLSSNTNLYFPAGVYLLASQFTITITSKNNIKLYGDSATIKLGVDQTSGNYLFNFNSCTNVQIENLIVDGNAYIGNGWFVNSCQEFNFINNTVQKLWRTTILVDGYALAAENCQNMQVSNNTFFRTNKAIVFDDGGTTSSNVTINQNLISQSGFSAIVLPHRNSVISNNTVDYTGLGPFFRTYGSGTTITRTNMRDNSWTPSPVTADYGTGKGTAFNTGSNTIASGSYPFSLTIVGNAINQTAEYPMGIESGRFVSTVELAGPAEHIVISGNTFEKSGTQHLYLTGVNGCSIVGNSFGISALDGITTEAAIAFIARTVDASFSSRPASQQIQNGVQNITFTGNVYKDLSGSCAKGIYIDQANIEHCINNISIANNTFQFNIASAKGIQYDNTTGVTQPAYGIKVIGNTFINDQAPSGAYVSAWGVDINYGVYAFNTSYNMGGVVSLTKFINSNTNYTNDASVDYPVQISPNSTGVIWTSGSGSPQGVLTATVGSLYTRTDGGANTTLYVKESGTGNTGWVAK